MNRSPFMESLIAFSAAMMGREDIEHGNKIILPPSCLQRITMMKIAFPYTFRLTVPSTKSKTFCGVLEFVAEDGKAILPGWMMRQLKMEEETNIILTTMVLPKAASITIQPSQTKFIELSNPKVVLEQALRFYSCLSKGDLINITYNNEVYEIEIKDCKPQDAVYIIDTDVNLEFLPPKDYVEPVIPKKPEKSDYEEKKAPEGKSLVRAQTTALEGVVPAKRRFPGDAFLVTGKKIAAGDIKESAVAVVEPAAEKKFDPRSNRLEYKKVNSMIASVDSSEPFSGAGTKLGSGMTNNKKKPEVKK